MPKSFHRPADSIRPDLRGRVIRIKNTVGTSWLVLDEPPRYHNNIRLGSVVTGFVSEVSYAQLLKWIQADEVEVLTPEQAHKELSRNYQFPPEIVGNFQTTL